MAGSAIPFRYARLPRDIARLEDMGLFHAAALRIRDLLSRNISEDLRHRLEYELERIERLKKDYCLSEDEALRILREEFPDTDEAKFREWERKGYVDYILVEGEKRYYRRFLWNLLFLCRDRECVEKLEEKSKERQNARRALVEHVYGILSSSSEGYVCPRRVRVRMAVRLKPGVVPEGETVRCWLPFPRLDDQQTDVTLIACSPKRYILAPPDHPQRTIYFESETSEKGAEFWAEFEYTVRGFRAHVDPSSVSKYDEDSPLFQKYTSEQPPHIVFTRSLRGLAMEIVGDEENPYLRAKRIYEWITENMTYTYVAEYSTYECIAEYVANNLRGDCGFHSILFITLCRIAGIPARWQSGWYANPKMKGPSPHDWAQFFVEPYGWLYADLSFGRYWRSRDPRIHEFYFGSIDSFRTVFNIDIMSQFEPPKKYLRSDPVDNQRGEMEWRGGNIYYDCFEYRIEYC